MPRLPTDADAFAGRFPLEQFTSKLPSPLLLDAGQPFFADIQSAFPTDWQINGIEQARLSVGAIATQIGVLQDSVNQIRDLFEVVPEALPLDKAWDVVRSGGADALASLAEFKVLQEALAPIAEATPIIGWVLEWGLSIYRSITDTIGAIEQRKNQADPIPERALAYDKDTDGDMTQRAIDTLKKRDWTPLFLPWVEAEGAVWRKVTFEEGETMIPGAQPGTWTLAAPEGRQFWVDGTPRSGRPSSIVPGSSFVERAYQYPLLGKSFDPARHVQTFQKVVPGLAGFAVSAWEYALKPGQNLYMVDGARVKAAWSDYYQALVGAITQVSAFGSANIELAVARVASWASVRASTPLALISASYKPYKEFSQYNPNAVPSEYRSGFVGRQTKSGITGYLSMEGLIAYIVDSQLRSRQFAQLNRLTVAYVSDASPAIQGDQKMADLLEERRRDLLQNPARAQVDLSQTPDWTQSDRDFSRALFQASQTVSPGDVPSGDPNPLVVIDLDPGVLEEEKRHKVIKPIIPGADGENGGWSILAALFGLGIVGGGAAYALRKRRRRR